MCAGFYLPSLAAWQALVHGLASSDAPRPTFPELFSQMMLREKRQLVRNEPCCMQDYLSGVLKTGAAGLLLACTLVPTGSLMAFKELSSLMPHQDWTLWAAQLAASRGDLHLLEWMVSLPPPVSINPIECAVEAAQQRKGHVLFWLRENNGLDQPAQWMASGQGSPGADCVICLRRRHSRSASSCMPSSGQASLSVSAAIAPPEQDSLGC